MKNVLKHQICYTATAMVILACSVCFGASGATTVFLKNGSVVEGIVETSSSGYLRIKTTRGVLTLRTEQIDSVQAESASPAPASPPPPLTTLGAPRLATLAHVAPANLAATDRELLQNVRGVLSDCANSTSETIAQFEHYVLNRTTPPGAELLMLCSECWSVAGEKSQATALLEDLVTSYPAFLSSVKESEDWAVQYLKNALETSIASGDADLGVRCLALLSKLKPDAVRMDPKLLWMAEAAALGDRLDFDKAMSVLMKKVFPIDRKTAFAEAIHILSEMDAYDTPFDERLLTLSIFSESTITSEYAKYVRAWYAEYGNLLVTADKLTEAQNLVPYLSALDTNSGLKLSNCIEFAQRRKTLMRDDNAALYVLAQWAKERGLKKEATQAFKDLAKNPEAAETAQLQLTLLAEEEQNAAFSVMTAAMEKGHYNVVLSSGSRFQTDYPDSNISGKVDAQMELARFRMAQASRFRPAKAESLVQNAERAYFNKNYALAAGLLLEVETDYGDTKSAVRARDLRRRMGIERPETVTYAGDDEALKNQYMETLAARAAYIGTLQAAYDQLATSLGKPSHTAK